jgi:hypothetical protein
MALLAATVLTGLFGTVTRSPITPVCRVGQPCSAPAPGVTLVFLRGGTKVASVVTTKTGTYRVRLAPGSYTVRVSPTLRIGGLAPSTVKVPRGVAVRRNFDIDTGIR